MSRPDNQIWQVTTKMPHGQLQVYRSTKIGERAVQINTVENYRGLLAIWMTLQLLNDQELPVVPWQKYGMIFDVFALITSFAIGDNSRDIFSPLDAAAHYALCLKDRPITHGIFPIVFHPDVLVQAVLHGDEIMVRNILKAKPDLTQIGTGIDFSGRAFTGTAIQAAIACGDFAPNRNSTGFCELLFEELKRQRSSDCYSIVEKQILQLYKKSLHVYLQKQEMEIMALEDAKANGHTIDDALMQILKERQRTYRNAIKSNDLMKIISTHTNPDPDPEKAPDAQKDNVIRVDQALIDAITNATDSEIQAVLDDPTVNSPLYHLIKQYRIDVDRLCQSEIIANPQHLLKLFTLYHAFYNRVIYVDPQLQKRTLFWCHLVGYVQRYLPACDAQLFAKPGLYNTVQNVARNSRDFHFQCSGDSIFPLSFDSHSGLGNKFAVGDNSCSLPISVSSPRCLLFTKLMSSKNSGLSELVKQLWETSMHPSVGV